MKLRSELNSHGRLLAIVMGPGLVAVLVGCGALMILFARGMSDHVFAAVFFLGAAWQGRRTIVCTHAWVELDGQVIRAKRLFSGLVVEWPVRQVDEVRLLSAGSVSLAGMIAAKIRGGQVGYRVRFHPPGRVLDLPVSGMTASRELAQAIAKAAGGRIAHAD